METAIRGKSGRVIGQCILAAQFFLNFREGVGHFLHLEREEGAAPGGFRDVFQDLVAFIVRIRDVGTDGVDDDFGALGHFYGFFASDVALVVIAVA